jgi:hypothetical protein
VRTGVLLFPPGPNPSLAAPVAASPIAVIGPRYQFVGRPAEKLAAPAPASPPPARERFLPVRNGKEWD